VSGAVLLDRDGTLVHDPGYLHEPAAVALLPGVADGLGLLAAAGWPLVIVSNQSGIARGLYGSDAFHAVNLRLEELLADRGVHFAGEYHCPHHPAFTGPCTCRKPAPALFRLAQADLGFDLARSWFVGNRLTDIEPASALGGRGILVALTALADDVAGAGAAGFEVARDFLAAASLITASTR
jgi:D-glycero-D-manno-heptose 1,7-bisphosphate phosphatase